MAISIQEAAADPIADPRHHQTPEFGGKCPVSGATERQEPTDSIARTFNAEGIKPPAARTWSSTMVAKTLRNPRYAGMVSYAGKHRGQAAAAGDGWSLVLFDDEGRPLLGSWEPVVPPKLWSQVQFEWQRRRQKAGVKPGEHRHRAGQQVLSLRNPAVQQMPSRSGGTPLPA
ncbi:recombinase family protein [Streptomyces tubercidicus]|uniref:recombinase family protein n=1 Tax=Streptomyces tubercidicus TaxID=47759 RepID=UPI002E107F15|nr:recombinase family protein [Streptomyces tubercidicus]WSX18516.1 recombinase family protein [Streptomyces tubercidicus]